MAHQITRFDATKLAELIRTREISPVEVMQLHLDRIETTDPMINAIVTIAGGSLDAAKAAEAAVMAGAELGPLHGVPFTVKDSITPQACSPSAARRSSGDGRPTGMLPASPA